MTRTSLALLLLLCSACAQAVDFAVSTISAADGQAVVAGTPQRFRGSPVSFLITFNAATSGTPDLTKIAVTNTLPGSEGITPVTGSGNVQWIYTVTPIADGPVTITIDAGFALRAGDSSPSIAAAPSPTVEFDTDPVITVAAGISGATATFTGTVVSGLLPSGTATWNTSALALGNCTLVSATVSGNQLVVTTTPFGYGTISIGFLAGAATDSYLNPSRATSGSVIYNAPSGGSAPQVSRVYGITPDNRVIHTGEAVDLAVEFSRAVVISNANPSLLLNATGDGPTAAATYLAGSGTNVLTFRYTVQAGNRTTSLDVAGSAGLAVPSGSAIVGAAASPDFIALSTVPSGGAAGSLSAGYLYSINIEASKPFPDEAGGGDGPSSCGVGSGIGLVLGSFAFVLLGLRRRR